MRFVSIDDWNVLDKMELDAGKQQGRPRVKFIQLAEMWQILDSRQPQAAD